MAGIDDSEYIELFLAEARENLETLNTAIVGVEADPTDTANVDVVFRVAHSVKGMAATMGYDHIAHLTHAMEDVFALLRERAGGLHREAIDVLFECMDMLSKMVDEVAEHGESRTDPTALESDLRGLLRDRDDSAGPEVRAAVAEAVVADVLVADQPADLVGAAVKDAQSRATVRVEAARLDTLLHMIGELVVRRSAVEQLAIENGDTRLVAAVGELTRASQSVQDMVMRVRMVPIDTAFARLPRLVRDLSHQLGKEVHLEIEGRDTELDRTAVDALVEPLMHLVRNAIDHGIEMPDVRKKAKKPEAGNLLIAARHEGGEVVIAITDDGAGINNEAVVARARERGIIGTDDLDNDQAIELLFTPGFSTRAEVTDVSGRGVGMDAVRSAVRGFGGDVSVRSEFGKGTTTELRMPLTLAILPALVVKAGGDSYALQLDRVDRTFKLEEVTLTTTVGQPVAIFDEGAMPVVNLAESFNRESAFGTPQFMVTVRSADRQLALVVDEMVGRRELVTRPVPERIRRDSPVSGGAVLASGEIAFIVDCEELIRRTLIEPVHSGSRQ
ncbi:MAG: chemotaxis protein CheA [Solirubrobacterales bacterium]|nr:chemotaxis protein CheA [Solirubrobacterales bacterium]